MVQTLKVTCPHCHQVAEIFLSTNACVIILNCPSCCAPIMYFDQKIFILTENQLEAIKNRARGSAMMNMLRKMAQPEEVPVRKHAVAHNINAEAERGSPSVPQASWERTSGEPIGSDDVTNLRIELALCSDVLEFIERQ